MTIDNWILYALFVIVLFGSIGHFGSKEGLRRLYTFLVFLIFLASAHVLTLTALTVEFPSTPKMFTSAGILVCAMCILHKRIN